MNEENKETGTVRRKSQHAVARGSTFARNGRVAAASGIETRVDVADSDAFKLAISDRRLLI